MLVDIQVAHAHILGMRLLKTIEVERGIAPNISLNHLSGEEISVVGSMIAEEQFGFRPLLHDNQHPAIYHHIDIRAQDIYHLNSPIDNNILWHIYEQSVLCKHCIEGCDGILVGLGEFGVIFCY